MKKCKHFVFLLFLIPFLNFAQDDLLDELNEETSDVPNYETAAFKGLKIVNFESTKLVAKREFFFNVQHRFGSVRNGFDDFFGLDDANTRIQFIYGISDGLNVGVSRSSIGQTYDAHVKYRIARQKVGGFPFTIAGYNLIAVNTELDSDVFPGLEFNDRLSYTSQLLISRKFTDALSLEVIPTFFHDNFVTNDDQDNAQFLLGAGGRYKLTKRFSINIDYGIHFNRADSSQFENPLSVGVDIETGGHVFQLIFSNAQGITENQFLGQANGDFFDGDFFFGFNLSRVFNF
ncbi:hypothetical protein GTQ40_04905 [Flavobacteriaceae bacterium R38]|nr:hypothetical protein [Flavobacteriaceae bacterium R38]